MTRTTRTRTRTTRTTRTCCGRMPQKRRGQEDERTDAGPAHRAPSSTVAGLSSGRCTTGLFDQPTAPLTAFTDNVSRPGNPHRRPTRSPLAPPACAREFVGVALEQGDRGLGADAPHPDPRQQKRPYQTPPRSPPSRRLRQASVEPAGQSVRRHGPTMRGGRPGSSRATRCSSGHSAIYQRQYATTDASKKYPAMPPHVS